MTTCLPLMMMDSGGGQKEGDSHESRWAFQQLGQNSEESKPSAETGLQVLMEAYLSKWNDRIHFKSFHLNILDI